MAGAIVLFLVPVIFFIVKCVRFGDANESKLKRH